MRRITYLLVIAGLSRPSFADSPSVPRGPTPAALAPRLAFGSRSARAEGSSQSKVKLNGYAEWRSDGFLIVDGQSVSPAEDARFEGEGRAARFQGIPLGYEVKVEGVRLSDGSVLARKIEAKPNGSALYEGAIRALADEMEREYRRLGRVAEYDAYGRLASDFGKLLERGSEVERARAIAERLIPHYLESEDFRVYVVDNEEWNAMTAPNGAIYVFSGLLRDLDDDEVAIVLGHELAHATHEHSRRAYKKSMLVSLAAWGATTAADSIDRDGARIASKVGIYAGTLAWMNGYGRGAEDQADRVGLRYAYEAGYDVRKGPPLWRRFAEKHRGLPKALNFFLGSHSVAKDRAKNLEQEIRFNYSNDARDR
jgi:Zn-dependent protease with chaperone function